MLRIRRVELAHLLCLPLCLLIATAAEAGTITVTDNAPFGIAGNATCTLAQAIAAANAANGVAAAAVGSATMNLGKCAVAPNTPARGANNVVFSATLAGATLAYSPADFASVTTNTNTADNYWYGPNALPPIASDITIDGGTAGVTLQINAGTSRLRFFYVGVDPAYLAGIATPGKGSLTLKNLTLAGGVQRGGRSGLGGGGAGMGGAVFNQGSLSLINVTLSGNSAIGGDWTGNAADGLSGGGMGEDAKVSDGGGFGGSLGSSIGGCCNGEAGTVIGTQDSSGMIVINGGRGGKIGTNGGLGAVDPHTGSIGDGGSGGQSLLTALGAGGSSGGGGAGFGGHGGVGGPAGTNVDAGGNGGNFGQGGHLVLSNNNGGGAGGGGGVGGGGASAAYSFDSATNTVTGASNDPGNGGFGGGGGYRVAFLGSRSGANGGFGGGGGRSIGCLPPLGCADVDGEGGFGAGKYNAGGGGGFGGAIFNHLGTVRLFQVTAFRNTAVGGNGRLSVFGLGRGLGAVLFNLNGSVAIDFSTLYSNGAATVAYNQINSAGVSVYYSDGGLDYPYCISSSPYCTSSPKPGVHYVDASVYSLAFGTQIKDGTASSANLSINNSIVAGTNQAGTEGNYNDNLNLVSQNATTVAVNDVVSHAVGSGNHADLVYQGANLVGKVLNLASQTAQSGGVATTSGPTPSASDPRLTSAAANHGPTLTMLPGAGSPAIDAAADCLDSNGVTVAFDQRGIARPQPAGGKCDVGAVELKQAVLNVTINGNGSVSAGNPPAPLVGAIATCTNAGGPSCAAGYSAESGWANVTLTATVPAGQSIAWSGDCAAVAGAPAKATVAMDRARACTATFTAIIIAPSTLANGTYGSAYAPNFSASGGIPAYTYGWAPAATSTLPPGLALTASGANAGQVSGTPKAAGTYAFTVTATDANGFSGAQSYTLTVNPAALTITATNQTKTYGQTLALGTTAFTTSALYPGDAVVDVTLTSAGAAAGAAVNGSPYAITPSTATGMGLSNYLTTYVNGSLTITAAATATILTPPGAITLGGSVNVTATVAVVAPGAGTPTDTIQISDGGSAAGDSCTIALPITSCSLTPSSAGGKTLTAKYIPANANFSGSSATAALTVNPALAGTEVATSLNPSVYGQGVTFTATVTGKVPTGSVTFTGGTTTLCSAVPLNGGGNNPTAACNTTILPVGASTITASYSGDGNNANSSGTLAQTVDKISTTTTITSSGAITLGSPVNVTATVAVVAPGTGAPTGTIQIGDGGSAAGDSCTINLPATSCSLTPSSTGSKTLTATYAPAANSNFSGSSGTSALVVNSASVGTVVSSYLNPSMHGQSVTFIATVTGQAPTGSVTFTSGTTVLCGAVTLTGGGNSPTAICATTALPVGANTIAASYSGDGNNASSSGTFTQVVNKKSTTISLAATPNPAAVGQTVTLTATVAGDPPTGTVSFDDNGVPLSCSPATLVVGTASSNAVCAITFTATGTHSITATYAGDANFAQATSSIFAVTVNASGAAPVPVPMFVRWTMLLLSGLLGAVGFVRLLKV